MRCENCDYLCYIESDGYYECGIFGDNEEVGENNKFEMGCKYTRKQLKKMDEINVECYLECEKNYHESFVEFMEEEEKKGLKPDNK